MNKEIDEKKLIEGLRSKSDNSNLSENFKLEVYKKIMKELNNDPKLSLKEKIRIFFVQKKKILVIFAILIALILTVSSAVVINSINKKNTPGEISKDTPVEEKVEYQIAGYIQKGPFSTGTSIKIQELDNNLNPVGTSYETTTKSDFGDYELSNKIKSKYVEVIASGYYFNEVSGSLSTSTLTLRAITDLSYGETVNVNPLTTLSNNRIKFLIKNDGKAFPEAKKQAEKEIMTIFNINNEINNFESLDISKEGDNNAVLLAVSVTLQGRLSVGELSELISKIALDIEKDGKLDDISLLDILKVNADQLNFESIKQNLLNRYEKIKIEAIVPAFELYAKRLLDIKINNINPGNSSTGVDFTANIVITFNKDINFDSLKEHIQVLDRDNKAAEIQINYDKAYYTATLDPINELSILMDYRIVINKKLTAVDSTYLLDDYVSSFTSMSMDIESNLEAYYQCNGDFGDSTGNGHNAEGINLTFDKNRNDDENSSCYFDYPHGGIIGESLRIPDLFNMRNNPWTYSMWLRLDIVPTNVVSFNMGKTEADITGPYHSSLHDFIVIGTSFYGPGALKYGGKAEQGKWVNITITFDGKKAAMYIDGNFQSEDTNLQQIFYNYNNGIFYISSLIGAIDDIKVYRRALNKYEVKKLYQE